MPKIVDIKGKRGDWTVGVNGQRLAVLHSTFWKPPNQVYSAPSNRAHSPGSQDYAKFMDALHGSNHVVIQKDTSDSDFKRRGYIGAFEFKILKADELGIDLLIIDRVAEPLPHQRARP